MLRAYRVFDRCQIAVLSACSADDIIERLCVVPEDVAIGTIECCQGELAQSIDGTMSGIELHYQPILQRRGQCVLPDDRASRAMQRVDIRSVYVIDDIASTIEYR